MEESPFRRIRELLRYAFTKDDYNDPHRPPPPQELKEFGQNTMLLLGSGLIFGGVQQVIQERRQPPPTVPPAYSKAEAAKLLGELNTRRLIRVMNSSLRGGLWCGWLGALYFGVEGLAEYGRNVRDPLNTVLGAWTSGAVFGLASTCFALLWITTLFVVCSRWSWSLESIAELCSVCILSRTCRVPHRVPTSAIQGAAESKSGVSRYFST